MQPTGAQILMRVLKEQGVDTLFGYPGGAVIDIYDELARAEIRHIQVRHEQGAVHAADGYAAALSFRAFVSPGRTTCRVISYAHNVHYVK